MYTGRLVFAQIMGHLPWHVFNRCVSRYHGDRYVKAFTCADQYRCMAFAQLTYRNSLRDIETCLRAQGAKLYHIALRGSISRNTLAHANQARDWRIHADFAQHLIHVARSLHAGDTLPGLICDQVVRPCGVNSKNDFPDKLRRIRYRDPQHDKTLVFLTNHFSLPALTIAQLYRSRWQVELFFKWIKQHLRIKAFFGTSANAVKTQIWIAVSVYVTVAILRKRLNIEASLYTMLQILSLTIFEKTPLNQPLDKTELQIPPDDPAKQLILFKY